MPKGVYKHKKRLVEERFWEKVDKSGPFPSKKCKCKGRCWTWMARIRDVGYGEFDNDLAHRVVWRLCKGTIPKGKYVLHHCDNRFCVNPEHLYIGTQKNNMNDKVNRDRQHKGVQIVQHVLTEKQVLWVRKHYVPYSLKYGQQALARKFGVTQWAIGKIVHGLSWRHL